ncbi:haloacid dehalogenase type II [Aquisalimonas sp.]|uniref:haloacid dehalogenase type II n=1 Tax=unclassified Aquisalimonas TaxID=2644645 RepID=UPI0025C18974|nr:haloacid dehalogenase type II [Aquisalimonas sp.]
MSRIIAFDVNETLLDLGSLDPVFERIFGTARARETWFSQVLQSAMTTTILGRYHDFSAIAAGAMSQTAERYGVSLSQKDRDAIAGGMRSLPPYADVAPALQRMRDAGLRMVALTNSTPQAARAQIDYAGLSDFFEEIMSVDMAQTLKPAPEVYNTAARSMLATAQDMRLVAAHAWDIAGAMNAGWAGAFLARPGQVWDPLFDQPDIIGATMDEVATAIIATDLEPDT